MSTEMMMNEIISRVVLDSPVACVLAALVYVPFVLKIRPDMPKRTAFARSFACQALTYVLAFLMIFLIVYPASRLPSVQPFASFSYGYGMLVLPVLSMPVLSCLISKVLFEVRGMKPMLILFCGNVTILLATALVISVIAALSIH